MGLKYIIIKLMVRETLSYKTRAIKKIRSMCNESLLSMKTFMKISVGCTDLSISSH